MYPRIRVEKRHPDGSPRAAWEAYRIDDFDGAIRLWAPPRTPRVHVNGHWVPEGPILTRWRPGEAFVISAWEETDATELYVDIVREAAITSTAFSYIDLYVDVMLRTGKVWSKDEELLSNLRPEEAARVLAIRDGLLIAMTSGSPPFNLGDPLWRVDPRIRELRPGRAVAL